MGSSFNRTRLNCRICNNTVKTYRDNKSPTCTTCKKVILNATTSLPANPQEGLRLDVERWPEAIWQHAIFKQVELDGLPHLGYGRLEFLHALQRSGRRMGKWTEGSLEFDLLLRSAIGLVCIEIKKKADRHSLIQCMDYLTYLENHRRNPGSISVCLLTVVLDKDFLALMEEAWKAGLKIELFCVDINSGGISLRRVGPALPDYDP